uniref:Uncharacterized protein n=1 Tax=viral metagenome TaxID=1070528 RepID=A0A6C0KXJ2_9ZZZZ
MSDGDKKKETMSNVDSDSDEEEDVEEDASDDDIIASEPLYHVLAEFLLTSDNKNIATVLSDICKELKLIRETLTTLDESITTQESTKR